MSRTGLRATPSELATFYNQSLYLSNQQSRSRRCSYITDTRCAAKMSDWQCKQFEKHNMVIGEGGKWHTTFYTVKVVTNTPCSRGKHPCHAKGTANHTFRNHYKCIPTPRRPPPGTRPCSKRIKNMQCQTSNEKINNVGVKKRLCVRLRRSRVRLHVFFIVLRTCNANSMLFILYFLMMPRASFLFKWFMSGWLLRWRHA